MPGFLKGISWSKKVLLGAAALTAFSVNAQAATTVVVDPAKKYQVFEGWGSSLCWWAEKVGAWSQTNRDKLLKDITDTVNGLGYNVFRYNIGGGDQPGHNHLTKGDGAAAVPGYKPTEKGNFDWTADPAQRGVAIALSKMVKGSIFEAFSNSPPWWMTNSGCVAGGKDGADNLKADCYDDFADYLSEVAKHFKDEWGITFRTVEPFNEPSAGWWASGKDQEGCGFKNNQSAMIIELGKALKKKGLFPETSVSAADESSIADAVKQWKGYSAEARSYMFQVNTHSYTGYGSRAELYNSVFAADKRIWQSETGPLHKGNSTEDITLWMANVIIGDLRDMKASAWVDWQLGDPATNWRTFALDHSKQSYSYGPRFYMHAAFSRFIRPGSRIIDSDNGNTVAALRPDGALVIVVRNSGSSAVDYNFDLKGFTSTGSVVKVRRFELPGSLKQISDLTVKNKTVSLTTPANTITTLVIADAEDSGVCAPSDIIPYVKVHNGGWNETTEVAASKGDSIVIGPHPYDGGRWVWDGPKDFHQAGREIRFKNMDGTYSGIYKGTYTNAVGCVSTVDIKLIVDDPEHPYVEPVEPPTDTVDVPADTTVTPPDTTGAPADSSATPADTSATSGDTTGTAIASVRNSVGYSVSFAGGDLHVAAPRQQLRVAVYDMQGVPVANVQFNGGQTVIPVANISRGAYIVQIRNTRGTVLFQRTLRAK
ncbi:MAG: T9SS type A sorting domain-containing protein [Fibrobacter sp.]|nr:T9SS type A sorting domain-containing protein [Fibrobacter sp.]